MIKVNIKITLILFVFILGVNMISAQDPHRFDDAINKYSMDDSTIDRNELIVFTGSSSVRIWSGLQTDFPQHNIINRGFGGSQMSDLLFFNDQLINQYKPEKVFIYEGDNDIGAGESTEDILKEAKALVDIIQGASPNTKIYFISAKPSVARWELKKEYEEFNYALSLWTLLKPGVHFIDVWTPMLNEDGVVIPDLFLGDNLHMNAKGYEIWAKVIGPYLQEH